MNKRNRVISDDQAYSRMTQVCARKEYSPYDISLKLNKMGIEREAIEKIILRLKKENYLNDERFTRSFVSDKLRFNGWGIKKIELYLKQKHLPQEIIDKIFEEYSSTELNVSLKPILEKKWKQIKGDSVYEKKGKLIRFALGRGFAMNEIIKCMNSMNLGYINEE